LQKLGTINLVVRCEVDAYTDLHATVAADGSVQGQADHTGATGILKTATPSTLPQKQQTEKFTAGLTIRHSASQSLVPQDQLVEIKTYTSMVDWQRCYPQSCFGKLPLIYTAQHQKGNFTAPIRYHVEDSELAKFSRSFDAGLIQLHDILVQILEAVRGQQDSTFFSLVQESGNLRLVKCKLLKHRLVDEVVVEFLQDKGQII
jgi:hypothetical protein